MKFYMKKFVLSIAFLSCTAGLNAVAPSFRARARAYFAIPTKTEYVAYTLVGAFTLSALGFWFGAANGGMQGMQGGYNFAARSSHGNSSFVVTTAVGGILGSFFGGLSGAGSGFFEGAALGFLAAPWIVKQYRLAE